MARVMYIMWEHEPEIIKAAHGVDGDEEVKKSTSTSTLTLADVGSPRGWRTGPCLSMLAAFSFFLTK